jgi:peptidoglycan/LPS O-acetylase OafA/YrhL
MKSEKIVVLEATRGIAAIVVLLNHLLQAFFPRFDGLTFPDERIALFGTPLFAFVNGTAAVVLFFVLSGFVLTVRAFQSRSSIPLIVGAVRRWPRLLGPVLIVNLASGFLAGWALYSNQPAASLIDSPWLRTWFNHPADQWQTVLDAANEGAVATFLFGTSYFNSNLWTMYYEFFGSFIAFALAGAMLLFGPFSLLGLLIVTALILLTGSSAYFLSFVLGVALAAFYSSTQWENFATWASQRSKLFWLAASCLIIVLFGYHEALMPTQHPLGLYAPLMPLYRATPVGTRVLLHGIASAAVLLLVLTLPGPKRWLGGPAGALLGRLSFPMYLLQVPVICSGGTALYIWLLPVLGGTLAGLIAAAGSAAAILMLSLPLTYFESWWLTGLRRCTDWIGQTLTLIADPRSPRLGSSKQ